MAVAIAMGGTWQLPPFWCKRDVSLLWHQGARRLYTWFGIKKGRLWQAGNSKGSEIDFVKAACRWQNTWQTEMCRCKEIRYVGAMVCACRYLDLLAACSGKQAYVAFCDGTNCVCIPAANFFFPVLLLLSCGRSSFMNISHNCSGLHVCPKFSSLWLLIRASWLLVG